MGHTKLPEDAPSEDDEQSWVGRGGREGDSAGEDRGSAAIECCGGRVRDRNRSGGWGTRWASSRHRASLGTAGNL